MLTAAHCTINEVESLRDPSTLQVVTGEHDVTDSITDENRHQVASIMNHHLFDYSTFDHDISILTLASMIRFSSTASPVCLPDPYFTYYWFPGYSDYIDQVATVTGWGSTAYGESPSSTLQEVNVTVISNDECSSAYGDRIKKYEKSIV